jgi:(E)-4-hydroxy-3-methylbut-2-enyl-diphosphate synthase
MLSVSLKKNPLQYSRRQTRVVMVGSVAVGGDNPIRVQSMTTTPTDDTAATVAQVKRLADCGCEIARITAPTVLDAKNLEHIKSTLIRDGYNIPLVADIHFRPDAAMVAADFVEKVRINPGNFVDGKAFKIREYTDEQYQDELKRLEEKFTPLVLKLKKMGKSMRIGTNHGSLSDRIMNRFGDTPMGMVESAIEYARVCRQNDYHNLIFSMKSSNPRVMIQAYRLLAWRMEQEEMDYPFHLGVTEAGDGEDGRIKSAAGIGSLLEDGIGDTIRVSLTEDPEFEVPVAQELARRYSPFKQKTTIDTEKFPTPYVPDTYTFSRRNSLESSWGPLTLGGHSPLRVVSQIDLNATAPQNVLELLEERLKKDTPPEILAIPFSTTIDFQDKLNTFSSELRKETNRLAVAVFMNAHMFPTKIPVADGYIYTCDSIPTDRDFENISQLKPVMLSLKGDITASVHGYRALVSKLLEKGYETPLLLSVDHKDPALDTAVILGSLICDGIGDAVSVASVGLSNKTLDFAYNLLQACGSRITKTEYVSCPSCGRTLFDLQSTTERIKSKTGHLKGVKIAIMGCIVNGPGEMADADFGYVGGGPGKINLYVGKTCVEKSIPAQIADEKLVALIKSNGKWVDPVSQG